MKVKVKGRLCLSSCPNPFVQISDKKMKAELAKLLALCSEVEENGGSATLSLSTKGGKSIFKFTLGSPPPAPATTASTSTSPPAPGNQAAGRRRRRNRGAAARARRNQQAAGRLQIAEALVTAFLWYSLSVVLFNAHNSMHYGASS